MNSNLTINELIAIDTKHVWHPYSSTATPPIALPVKAAYGSTIELMDGRTLTDGVSSWWATIHGYNHPALNNAAKAQIDKMSHIMLGGLTHEPIVELTRKLINIVPKGLSKFFFCDSGSVAVEVALKMALQYWHAKGNKKKNRFVALEGAYHGDTWHAMSVCDPVSGMHHIFNEAMPQHFFVKQPSSQFHERWNPIDTKPLRDLFEKHAEEIAAFIVEPVMQGAGGMYFYHPEYLRQARQLCDEYGILLIFDEVATGFGRTGKLFAAEHAAVIPDIMCLGKAINGGFMTFAATLATEQVANVIADGNPGIFMHGPTYMGNPLACAVACASIDLLLSSEWENRIAEMQHKMLEWLQPALSLESVSNVRTLGATGVVEMKHNVNKYRMISKFVELGVWIRPFDNIVYIMPPYIITDNELKKLCDAIIEVLKSELNEL